LTDELGKKVNSWGENSIALNLDATQFVSC